MCEEKGGKKMGMRRLEFGGRMLFSKSFFDFPLGFLFFSFFLASAHLFS